MRKFSVFLSSEQSGFLTDAVAFSGKTVLALVFYFDPISLLTLN